MQLSHTMGIPDTHSVQGTRSHPQAGSTPMSTTSTCQRSMFARHLIKLAGCAGHHVQQPFRCSGSSMHCSGKECSRQEQRACQHQGQSQHHRPGQRRSSSMHTYLRWCRGCCLRLSWPKSCSSHISGTQGFCGSSSRPCRDTQHAGTHNL